MDTEITMPATSSDTLNSNLNKLKENKNLQNGNFTFPTVTDDDEESVDSLYGHTYLTPRNSWLRAAVLGANDGLVSVASLILGVVAASKENSYNFVILSAVSGGLGEYVSVSSQKDTEKADVKKEKIEHEKGPRHRRKAIELLTQIYVKRGLNYNLARRVAVEFTKKNPVENYVKEELGINVHDLTNPLQAAVASVLSFSFGACGPLLMVVIFSDRFVYSPTSDMNSLYRLTRILAVSIISLTLLILFGGVASYLGGASILKGCFRVGFGGSLALAGTFIVGLIFDA
ncbi:hypothetical protein HK099_006279 [Clydaea vesicula]|uniref:Uncharacterized protein n=1 Tax=Clydaea vesicula TaxID=447962 RepID=A0AAD5XUD5_9FUNG|nr:hypothetical protein HK099_006279 [Clydaea vesicula]